MEWITTTTVLDRLGNQNDHSAWDDFSRRFRAPIVSFGRKLGLQAADAEEVAQDTMLAFLEAHRKSAYQRGRGRLSHFLFGIAHNKILMARRKIAAREAQFTMSGGESALTDLADESAMQNAWDMEWRQLVLRQCLDQVGREVSQQTLDAFRLVVFDGVSPAEAAEMLGITRNSVFIAKHRVGSRLRQLCAAFDEE